MSKVHHKHNDASAITHVMLSIPDCVEVTRANCEMYDKNLDTDGQGRFHCYACGG